MRIPSPLLRTMAASVAIVGGLAFATTGSRSVAAQDTTTATAGPAAAVIRLETLPLLFADDAGVRLRHDVVRTVHRARTDAQPVVVADRPWEGDRVYIYGSVLRDARSGRYRMWYGSRPQPEGPGSRRGGVPGMRADGFDVVMVADSADGITWTKPPLDLFAYRGSRANNIVYDLHSPSVLLDARAGNPAERYKMLGTFDGNYYSAHSPDGLRWTAYPRNPVLTNSDTITMTQDPGTGEFLAFHKKPATVRGHPRRVVWLSRSRDMQSWSDPELVFTADEIDDRWVRTPVERTEVYNMSVYPHAAGFLGLPTIFRVMEQLPRERVAPGQSPVDGPIDVEFATSQDGRTWQRTSRREAVIPRGAPGSFDYGAILGVSSTPVHTDTETWVYYTALTTGHGGPIPPKRIAIGRAVWRRHGFVSLDAGPDGGRVETRPVHLATADLEVNVDASRGRVRVAVLDADGTPLPGFDLDASEPATTDAPRWRPRWRGPGRLPTDRPVRLVFELTNARLYSVSVSREASSR